MLFEEARIVNILVQDLKAGFVVKEDVCSKMDILSCQKE
ncbi:hypothetical protein FH5_05259 [Priestia endophytica]|nr:hypothetical protein FH5_05259 [Priestia endophytica]